MLEKRINELEQKVELMTQTHLKAQSLFVKLLNSNDKLLEHHARLITVIQQLIDGTEPDKTSLKLLLLNLQ